MNKKDKGLSVDETSKEEEEEYVEEEDSDFDPDKANNEEESSSDEDEIEDKSAKTAIRSKKHNDDAKDEEFDIDTEREVKKANYSRIESAEGGLIKTRTQRALESQLQKQFNFTQLNEQGIVDIEDAWAKLQSLSKERLKIRYSSSSPSSDSTPQPPVLNSKEQIKIKRTYEYAGEVITEEKWVDRESFEAKQYLNTLKDNEIVESSNDIRKDDQAQKKQRLNDRGEKLRIIRKRPPLLEGIINGSIKPKFNTLEKSKVDFAKFVDKEGIDDELTQHNKNGYLERQDFLSRVQLHKDSQIKDIRRKELANRNNQ